MSWGTDLWDQFDKVTDHTQRGIEFCERYSHFVKERSKVETEYASSLRSLAKKYTLKTRKEDDNQFTLYSSFNDSLKEVSDVAGQHELLSENLVAEVVRQINQLVAELKSERKKHIEESRKLESALGNQMKALDQSKKKYEKAYREASVAEDVFKAADANYQLSRAEVDKAKQISHQKQQVCSDCKAGYAQVLEKTNQHQKDYYNKSLPQVFQSLQEMDEKRINKVKSSIKTLADQEKKIQPIINTCLEGVITASSKIDPDEDSRRVVEKYKSGFIPPEDIPFEDLSNEDSGSIGSANTSRNARSETMKGTSKKQDKKRSGIKGLFGGNRHNGEEKEDFSHLNPSQQKKELSKKIQAIKKDIAKENSEREGCIKMRDVYTKNPSMGDPNTLRPQLEQSEREMDQLNQELLKYENYLQAAETGNRTPQMQRRLSSGSRNSVNSTENTGTPAQVTSTPYNGSSNLPVSSQPVRDSVRSATSYIQNYEDSYEFLHSSSGQHSAHPDSFDDDDEFYEGSEVPVDAIGKALALFTFQATSAGSISVNEQEYMSIIESDTGDGWTRVRRVNGDEGFVPTSYIKIE